MMKCVVLFAAMMLFTGTAASRAETHEASGMLLRVDRANRSVAISCDPVAGDMGAMEMSFSVDDARPLAMLPPGTRVRFTIEQRGKLVYAVDVRSVSGENFESEPMEAAGMTALQDSVDPSLQAATVEQGALVPDFSLADQADRTFHLSAMRGRVVVLTFGYSRCPDPQYCFRLSDNLAHVESRFSNIAGSELVLVTIAIDPEHDRGQQLRDYAAVWHADPAKWHFLTGPLPQVKQVAGMFNMDFWRRGGLFMHSLHTVIIGRDGRLVANLDGNRFTAQQLGDLVQAALSKND